MDGYIKKLKKIIACDPVLDLMAFYAARGITPEEIRHMSYEDLAILIAGRWRYYYDEAKIVEAGILNALSDMVGGKNV